MNETASEIAGGRTFLGIEAGSTRIKAVLTDSSYRVIATASAVRENKFENGYWTYDISDIFSGLRECYLALKKSVKEKTGETIRKLAGIGISGMMHGYIATDDDGNLLVPFRTWRNTVTGAEADELTLLFGVNIPQRWSIAHLYRAIRLKEEHIRRIKHIYTLSGYIHSRLTGKNILGIGDASGMFPVGESDYDKTMTEKFNRILEKENLPYRLEDILPIVALAGQPAGYLSHEGAVLLDSEGDLEAGIPFCPPEGDAGTGMVATNSVRPETGNVSAGTSVFAMIVLKEKMKNLLREIDIVSTPDGKPCAMVHCNNCTTDINAYAGIFLSFAKAAGIKTDLGGIFSLLFRLADEGKPDCSGLCSVGYHSGEHITGITRGVPIFAGNPEIQPDVRDFIRSLLYSAVATLRIGMQLLKEKENINVTRLLGHGGYFREKGVGQKILASALRTSVAVTETASEGGAYGMALLAAFMAEKDTGLSDFLDGKVFRNVPVSVTEPDETCAEGFDRYAEKYELLLRAERVIQAQD